MMGQKIEKIALKLEDRDTSQGIQVATRSWEKNQRNKSFFQSLQKKPAFMT